MKTMKSGFLILLLLVLTVCFTNQQIADQPAPYQGDWTLMDAVHIPGITMRDVSIHIATDMSISGFTGCHLFTGNLNKPEALTVPMQHDLMCLPEIEQQEASILSVLSQPTRIKVVDDTLIIKASDQQLIFEKADIS